MVSWLQFLDKARQKAREKKLAEKAAEALQKQDEGKATVAKERKAAQAETKRVSLSHHSDCYSLGLKHRLIQEPHRSMREFLIKRAPLHVNLARNASLYQAIALCGH